MVTPKFASGRGRQDAEVLAVVVTGSRQMFSCVLFGFHFSFPAEFPWPADREGNHVNTVVSIHASCKYNINTIHTHKLANITL